MKEVREVLQRKKAFFWPTTRRMVWCVVAGVGPGHHACPQDVIVIATDFILPLITQTGLMKNSMQLSPRIHIFFVIDMYNTCTFSNINY